MYIIIIRGTYVLGRLITMQVVYCSMSLIFTNLSTLMNTLSCPTVIPGHYIEMV